MKFTVNWLKRHLDTSASLEEICTALTAIGLEVEEVIDREKQFAPFKVAYVESAEQHPDADKLRLCQVKTEDGMVQVVCGAHNAKAGMYGIFAPSGSYVPGIDLTLKPTKIRGVESNGMLVSEREMCISDEHDGIIELNGSPEIGTPMSAIFGLDDPIIDIALTPNRADCAGVRGIARDLAAAGLGTLKPLKYDITDVSAREDFTTSIDVVIEDEKGCPHFVGREVRNIQNTSSPKWMQSLLSAIGLRPISALVDITSFMSIDCARPLHVYDADKLTGNIVVRATVGDETLEALDKKTYKICKNAIGITDDSGVLGLGGIVGGQSTGVDEDTKNVFIESAYFNPTRIAKGGREMGVVSDARYRFERGIDPAFTAQGLDIATAMVASYCGNDQTQVGNVVAAGSAPDNIREIAYAPAYFETLIGFNVPHDQQKTTLESLGFAVAGFGDTWTISPPSWRDDVFGKADIVEEVVRIVGFDKIPAQSVPRDNALTQMPETPNQKRGRLARLALCSRGLSEAVTWSFMNADRAQYFGTNDNDGISDALKVSNPISSELGYMRPSLLPNLLEASARNDAQGHGDVSLFEIGPVFTSPAPDGQAMVAAGIRSGSYADRHWAEPEAARAVDSFDAKADAMAALLAMGAPVASARVTRDAPSYYHPGQSGAISLGRNVLAYFGTLHPTALESLDIKTDICAFEIFMENIPTPKGKKSTNKKMLTLDSLQPVRKDFAFVVADSVNADDVLRSALAADKKLIVDGYVFDIYAGKGVEDGHKSVAINITIQPKNETLNDKDLEALMNKVTENVEKKIGGVLRG